MKLKPKEQIWGTITLDQLQVIAAAAYLQENNEKSSDVTIAEITNSHQIIVRQRLRRVQKFLTFESKDDGCKLTSVELTKAGRDLLNSLPDVIEPTLNNYGGDAGY